MVNEWLLGMVASLTEPTALHLHDHICNFEEIEDMESFVDAILANPCVTDLYFDVSLNEQVMKELARAVKMNCGVRKLEIRDGWFENEGVWKEALALNTNLTDLSISGLDTHSAIIQLQEGLAMNTTVKNLRLHNFYPDHPLSIQEIENFLGLKHLTGLNLRNTKIDKAGHALIAQLLKEHQSADQSQKLVEVDLSATGLDLECLYAYLDAFNGYTSLVALHFSAYMIETASEDRSLLSEAICQLIRNNPALSSLHLGGIQLSDSVEPIIRLLTLDHAYFLNFTPPKVHLNLSKTGQTADSLREWLPLLQTQRHRIQYLDLSHNGLGDAAVPFLTSWLEHEVTLECCDLRKNKFSVKASSALVATLETKLDRRQETDYQLRSVVIEAGHSYTPGDNFWDRDLALTYRSWSEKTRLFIKNC